MISIVLSGGVGSRLWPVSRAKLPKQFCQIFEETLFTKTIRRFNSDLIVISNAEQKVLVDLEIKNIPNVKAFYEPMGRNTAPAVALACGYLIHAGKQNEICGVFPSDHWINNESAFNETLMLANEIAQQGQIVTLGITPNYPSTGYGYIELTQERAGSRKNLNAFKAKGFHEKPKLELAKEFLAKKNFVWNSGMFIFKVKDMAQAFQEQMPELWHLIREFNFVSGDLKSLYEKMPSISLDYGVMEKIKNHVCIPSDFGWSDLGSWDDVAAFTKKNINKTIEIDAANNFTLSENNKTIALVGVSDVNVIDAGDALLIVKKGEGQKVRHVVEELDKKNSKLTKEHSFDVRPWGDYRNLYESDEFKTKVITVNSGEQLSYQSHQKREEIWIVTVGTGEVVVDDVTTTVGKGTVIKIPKLAKHRIRNTGSAALIFVEVQLGEYFGEDDIKRFSDDYGRVK